MRRDGERGGERGFSSFSEGGFSSALGVSRDEQVPTVGRAPLSVGPGVRPRSGPRGSPTIGSLESERKVTIACETEIVK